MKSLYHIDNFDWEIYAYCNPDLKKNNIITKEQVLNHFKTFGLKENRFINSKQLQLYFYYDWNLYKNEYSKLQHLSNSECFFYYIKHGILEKHTIQLKQINDQQMIIFFIKDIKNLKYYHLLNQYNWSLYKEKYNLYHLNSDFDSFLHYIKYGLNNNHTIEKNIVPITFFYSSFFEKINNIQSNFLLKTYINQQNFNLYYTIIEQYLFENYDWNMYLNKNQDLNKVYKTELDGFKHYITYGISEKRKIYEYQKLEFNIIKNIINLNLNKIDFDFYKSYYEDLNEINDLDKIKQHYFKKGIFEHRVINSDLSYFDMHKNFLFFINQINEYNHNILDDNYLLYSSYHYYLYIEYDWYDYNKKYLKDDLFNNKLCIQHYLNNKSNEIFKKKTINIDKNLYGIAISLYIDKNTPYERVLRSKKCIESILKIMSDYKILIVIDYEITIDMKIFLDKLKKKYTFSIYKHTQNYGIAYTKNSCIKLLQQLNKKYFCLLDDDIFIKQDFLIYLNDLFTKYHISFFSNSNFNFNKENNIQIDKYHFSKLKYFNEYHTFDYYGNLLIINSEYINNYGYFTIFKNKIGVEHIEITRRYLFNNEFEGYGLNLDNYIENFEIINDKNTLFLHSKNVDTYDYNLNVKIFNKLKKIYYRPLKERKDDLILLENILNTDKSMNEIIEYNKKILLRDKNLNNIIKENNILNKNLNFIDYICWINLERSNERRKYMDILLKDINIPNQRINAIDGNNLKINKSKLKTIRNLSNYEIACTLSHLKCINFLKNIKGEYFMICEDDISFDNLYVFNYDLEKIIKDCPDFDILLIYKTYFKEIKNNYEKWSDHEVFKPHYDHICGTVCYIVSKKGLNKLLEMFTFENEETLKLKEGINFDVADIFLYKKLNTYAYKYNFITTKDEESSIHEKHLDFHRKSINYQLNNLITNINNF